MKIEKFYNEIKNNIITDITNTFTVSTIDGAKKSQVSKMIDTVITKVNNVKEFELYMNGSNYKNYNDFMSMYVNCILIYFYIIIIFNFEFISKIYITNLNTTIENILIMVHDLYLDSFINEQTNTYIKFKNDLEFHVYNHICKWIETNYNSSILKNIKDNIKDLISKKYIKETNAASTHILSLSNAKKSNTKIEKITSGNEVCDNLYEYISNLQNQIETVKRNHDILKNKLNALENALLH